MPIYEYKCDACGHVLDALQKIDEEPLKFCPSCSKASLRKLISAPSFRLKGGGWYETDFKSDKETKRNLAETDKSDKKKDKAEKKAGSEKSEEKKTPAQGSKDSTSKGPAAKSAGNGGGSD